LPFEKLVTHFISKGAIKLECNDLKDIEIFAKEAEIIKQTPNNKLILDSENIEQGLAKLVLTVIELLRKLMETQALRRIENESVTDEETERMGEAFYKLEEKMKELREIFNLEEKDLNIDLGPLGSLF
jgi:hypothetical protein